MGIKVDTLYLVKRKKKPNQSKIETGRERRRYLAIPTAVKACRRSRLYFALSNIKA